MAADKSASWIKDGEKYGLVGLEVKLEGQLSSGIVGRNLWVLTDAQFDVPKSWREWLGSVRADDVEGCNLFLLSKQASVTPDVLDAEDKVLQQRVWYFYVGLLLASTFSPSHEPVLLTGSRQRGKIGIRQQQELETPIAGVIKPYPPIVPDDIQHAAMLGENLEILTTAPLQGGHWRLFKTLRIYIAARATAELVDRIHQYSRCIDGLILPSVGKTRREFKSKTEIFIGPGHHEMMGEIYDVRSAVEHLHENRYLETFDRSIRLDLAKKEAVVERLARTALARVIANRPLWAYFSNTAALEEFWALPPYARHKIWGEPINPLDAIADFNSQFIHDGMLGR